MISETSTAQSEAVRVYKDSSEVRPKSRVLVVDYSHKDTNEDAWLLIAYYDGQKEVSVGMTLPRSELKRLWFEMAENLGFEE